jgi:translation initiation factor IF-2
LHALHPITFDDVADSHVLVVLERHAAFLAGDHFLDVIHEGKLSQLKRFKDDVKEVVAGQECGMAFENYQDMRVGDIIECYRVEMVQRSL